MPQTVVPINLRMVNAYLIKGEKPILVDTGTKDSGIKLIDALAAAGVNPKDLSLIIITHGHSDHFGGLKELKKICGAKIMMGSSDAEDLAEGRNSALKPNGLFGYLAKMVIPKKALDEGIKADIVVEEETSLEEYGVTGKVIPTSGHTRGSISVLLDSGDALVGDLIFGGFTHSRPMYSHFVYDLNLDRDNIRKLLEMNAKKFYVGHGGPFTAKEVEDAFDIDLSKED